MKKRESMVFDHPKLNPYSDLQFLLSFLCALPFTQFVKKLYIWVVGGSQRLTGQLGTEKGTADQEMLK